LTRVGLRVSSALFTAGYSIGAGADVVVDGERTGQRTML